GRGRRRIVARGFSFARAGLGDYGWRDGAGRLPAFGERRAGDPRRLGPELVDVAATDRYGGLCDWRDLRPVDAPGSDGPILRGGAGNVDFMGMGSGAIPLSGYAGFDDLQFGGACDHAAPGLVGVAGRLGAVVSLDLLSVSRF